ncbi:GSY2-interacting protein PIG2 [Candida viswanathii]|uniref:GSY2-interacting protein PIG2 n=1 Tax=Candida viswanathii TaxID=5486 RepID=A0A367XPU2_9ASCO|nr:GSY2-interacting protein PIG2 [Candida viswanathii]
METNINNTSPSAANGDVPLSMKFLHKPRRSVDLYIKSNDQTKLNSKLNSQPINIDTNTNTNTTTLPTSSDYFNITSSTASPPPELEDYKLVRKKSGELVKPSLKSPTYYYKKRSMSLPTTPTYKQVHFGGSTDVKYFHKKDRPTAISASNSPKLLPSDNSPPFSSSSSSDDDDDDDDDSHRRYYNDDDSDDDYACDSQDSLDDSDTSDGEGFRARNTRGTTRYPKPSFDWELKLTNFAPLSYLRKIEGGTPVFLEKMFISSDKKNLFGYIAVKNMAFEKHLTVRYSLDQWLTIIEIPTIYLQERPEVLKLNDYDRFMFKIPLNNLFNSLKFSKNSSTDSLDNYQEVHERTYQMCIKYDTNHSEYWDNNNYKNYEVKLKRLLHHHPRHNRQFHHNHPQTIGAQIQDHAKKPRYSNSYLKRVASESDIESVMKSSETATEPESSSTITANNPTTTNNNNKDNLSNPSEISDFVKNNYYLSSPLLSSLHKNPETDEYFVNSSRIASNNDANQNGNQAKYKAKFQPHLSKLDTSDFNRNFVDDNLKQPKSITTKSNSNNNNNNNADTSTKNTSNSTSSVGPSITGLTNRNKFLNSKSYKELLENYCFFSSDTQEIDPLDSTNRNNSTSSSSSNTSSAEENDKITRNGSFTVSSFLGT